MRRNLKEAVGKPLVRRKEITYKARLREMSRQRATKSNNQEAIRIITDIREIKELKKKYLSRLVFYMIDGFTLSAVALAYLRGKL